MKNNKTKLDFEEYQRAIEEYQKTKDRECPQCAPRCPWCDHSRRPWNGQRCTLNQPLMMVIPPEGVHLDCPVHSAGHHIFGSGVSWMEKPTMWKHNYDTPYVDSTYRPIDYQRDPSKDLTFDNLHSKTWKISS